MRKYIYCTIKLDSTFFDSRDVLQGLYDVTDWNETWDHGLYLKKNDSKGNKELWFVGFRMKSGQARAVFSLGGTVNSKFQSYGDWIPLGTVGSSKASMTNDPQNSVTITTFESGFSAPGVAVGIVDASGSGQPLVGSSCHGFADLATGNQVTSDTVFEIGSITKVFTGTMLAKAVEDGDLRLNKTAQKYYNDFGVSISVPKFQNPNGEDVKMTLKTLAGYTSGISYYDTNGKQFGKSPNNTGSTPYNYSFADMHTYLQGSYFASGLPAEPGQSIVYCNTNFGILSELLQLQASSGSSSTSYEDLLSNLISGAQLNMNNTGVITTNSPTIANLAQGYDDDGTPNSDYALTTWPAFQGAGAIYSTIDDMLEWLQFNMGLVGASSYQDAVQTAQEVRYTEGNVSTGLGWYIADLGNDATRIYKNGGTNGFASYIGFLPQSKIGVVVLCNASVGGPAISRLGKDILSALDSR